MKRIADNGFARDGRSSLKVIVVAPGLEMLAINDLMSIGTVANLFAYNSIYRKIMVV